MASRIWRTLALLLLAALPLPAQIDEKDLLFGFEPTASNRDVYRDDRLKPAYQERVIEALLVRMPGATREGRYGVRWQGQLWHVGTDPGVIEVQPPPMRLHEVESKLDPLYRAFGDAGLSPYWPGTTTGSGAHIHVDRQVFVDNPLLLRNLLVDVHNRPYIRAVFGHRGDNPNARPVFERGEQAEFHPILGKLGAHARANGGYDYRIMIEELAPLYHAERYRDVNLQNLWSNNPPTIEVRMMARQAGAQDIRDQTRFLARYVAHLERSREPIPTRTLTADEYRQLRSAGGASREFYRLLGEIGLERAPYERFVDERFAAHDRANFSVRRELGGAGQFAAAYVLKEALAGNLAGAKDLTRPEFWTSLAVFTIAARATDHLLLRGLARAAVPLAAGMAAVQLASGNFSLADLAIGTGSYLAAGVAVGFLADTLVYPALFAAGPPGWIAAGAYTIAKLAVTLYVGEKLASLFERGPRSDARGGLQRRLDEIRR